MDNTIMKMKMELSKLEDEKVMSERYYRNRIEELRTQIKKLIDERNRRLSEEN